MANSYLSQLLAGLADDFDISVEHDEADPNRVRVLIDPTETQLRAARTRVIAARADLEIAEAEILYSVDSASSD